MVAPIRIKLRVTPKSYEPTTFSSLSEAAKRQAYQLVDLEKLIILARRQ